MMRRRKLSTRRLGVVAVGVFVLLAAACTSIVRVSVSSDGMQANGPSRGVSLSHDGRYVAFESWASNLVAGDTNGTSDIFVRDNQTKAVERVNVTSTGAQAIRDSSSAHIDDSGRYVAFMSEDMNLGGIGARNDYVHDRQTGTTQYIAWADGFDLDLSGNGRYLTTVQSGVVLVCDRVTGTCDGSAGAGAAPTISDDGGVIAFTRPRPSGSEGATTAFVLDRSTHTSTQIPFPTPVGIDASYIAALQPHVSGNGRYVAFLERELKSHPTLFEFNYIWRVFLYDRQAGALQRVDVADDGRASPGNTGEVHGISDDGNLVMFRSSGLLVADADGADHEFVRDVSQPKNYLVDRNQDEQIADGYSSYDGDIAGGGNKVAFTSDARNLVKDDTNGALDVFVRSFPGAEPPQPSSTTTR
jgi:Tol biopolymer transport system component